MLKFLQEYIKNPKFIGAVAPSSDHLAEQMVEDINFTDSECIIEYGPGTGVFTKKLIEKKQAKMLLFVIEQNESFYHKLVSQYGNEENVIFIHDDARNIKKHLTAHNIQKVDYIVSGLPFTSLPAEVSHQILTNTKELIADGGTFITFQYSLAKKKLFEQYFCTNHSKRVMRNLPPAYVLHFKAK